jgi:hypothetical protein
MLEPDQWVSVPGSITGTVYRGTERISSNALLNLIQVGSDRLRTAGAGCRQLSGIEDVVVGSDLADRFDRLTKNSSAESISLVLSTQFDVSEMPIK